MLRYFVILILLVGSCTSNTENNTTIQNNVATNDSFNIQRDSLNNVVKTKLKNHIQAYVDIGKFSGSILVAKGGTVLFKGGFGFADYAGKIQNRADTRNLIGSTTKSFTAIALMRYFDKGLVDLNVPVSNYLPNLKKELSNKLTLDILLRMKSGLPNHLERLTNIEENDISTSEIVEIINRSEFEYNPGTQYSYSNLNYHLIAAILEEISGLSYDQVLAEEIFLPLQMENSGSGNFDSIPNRALGYYVGDLTRTEDNKLSYAVGSGSIYSTVEDIYKWDQALYDDNFLSKKSKEITFRGGPEAFGYYGYGFRIREYERADTTLPPGVLVRHGGMMKGYLANVHRYLDDRITVIILGNISMFPIRDLTTELKNLVIAVDY